MRKPVQIGMLLAIFLLSGRASSQDVKWTGTPEPVWTATPGSKTTAPDGGWKGTSPVQVISNYTPSVDEVRWNRAPEEHQPRKSSSNTITDFMPMPLGKALAASDAQSLTGLLIPSVVPEMILPTRPGAIRAEPVRAGLPGKSGYSQTRGPIPPQGCGCSSPAAKMLPPVAVPAPPISPYRLSGNYSHSAGPH